MRYIPVLCLAVLGVTAAFPQTSQVTLNSTPSRAVGQPPQVAVTAPESSAPNLVEGREFYAPESVAIDSSVTPPILYVSDTGNNRVLAWKNATSFTNGQHADLVIGQQDFFSTTSQGPGQTFSSGLSAPTGIAVYNGDLYVADSGNNRILRYPKPFQQRQVPLIPDLFVGQPNINTRTANYTGQTSGYGIALASGSSLFQCFLAFDSSGNLWISDAGNNRVLRFPNVSNQTGGGVQADIVIGQANLTSLFSPVLQSNQAGQNTTNQLLTPSALAFDSAGRLYIADALSRVLVFANPAAAPGNASADKLLGVYPPGSSATSLTQLGTTEVRNPSGIFFLPDNSVGVVDSGLNRIVIFPPYTQWTQTPQPAIQPGGVVGQNLNFTSFNANASNLPSFTGLSTPPPNNNSFWNPTSAVLLPGATPELYVADTGNNRVLRMPIVNSNPSAGNGTTSTAIVGNAEAVLGQDRTNQYSINLVEGREFNFTFQSGTSATVDAGLALDTSGSTPHLYVADPYNHRVLGFADARKIQAGQAADIVIGQPDLATALCNYPTGDPNQPKQTSLCRPTGVLVAPNGDLYVADSGNGRVLRFPAPFNYKGGPLEPADLVLGQQNFTTVVQDPGPATMKTPYGLAFTGTNGLLVSDQSFNRVLYFKFTGNGTFTAGNDNGLAAIKVFGQPSFTSTSAGSGLANMSSPHHISTDTDGKLYVADSGNSRVLVFSDPNNVQTPSTGASAALPLSISTPRGIYVNPSTGEIWVTTGATVVRYPQYSTLLINPASTGTVVDAAGSVGIAPLAVTQDQYGDLFVADQYNRVVAYYQGLAALNGASNIKANPVMAPGVIATLYPLASATQFGSNTAQFNGNYPVPTTLGDVQVTVNGTLAPLYLVSPGQINMIVPMNAPTTGTAEFEVTQVSTGQILAAFQVPMAAVAPGIFLCSGQGSTTPAACVVNQDGTVNGPSNPAPRGSIVSIYATGQGVVPNAPADGVPASGLLTTPNTPHVIIGSNYVDGYTLQPGEPLSNCPGFICYSGLNAIPGMWQINVEVPKGVPPSSQTPAFLNVVLQDTPAWQVQTSGYRVLIYIGQ